MAKKSVSQDWRSKNYNLGVRVSNQTINQLRAGKTFSQNVANFKKTGMTAEQREGLNRFYGKARVSSALGNGAGSAGRTTVTAKKVASNPVHARSSNARVADWSTTTFKAATVKPSSTVYKTPSNTSKPSAVKKSSKSFWSKAGGFVTNELLGIDDFKRTANYVRKGQWGKATKSAITGVTEAGSTIGAAVAAIPTGGLSLAARGGAVAARQGAKFGAKQAGKVAGKKAARVTLRGEVKTSLKGAAGTLAPKRIVKTVAAGSLKTGVKGAAKTARYASTGGSYAAGQAARRAAGVAGKGLSKVEPGLSKMAAKTPSKLAAKSAAKKATAAQGEATSARAAVKAAKGAAAKKSAQKAYTAAKAKADAAGKLSRSTNTAYQKANAARSTYRKGAVRAKAGVLAVQGVNKAKQRGKKK